MATRLPHVHGTSAAEVVRESLAAGKSPRDVIRAKQLLPPDEIERLFSPRNMTGIE